MVDSVYFDKLGRVWREKGDFAQANNYKGEVYYEKPE